MEPLFKIYFNNNNKYFINNLMFFRLNSPVLFFKYLLMHSIFSEHCFNDSTFIMFISVNHKIITNKPRNSVFRSSHINLAYKKDV